MFFIMFLSMFLPTGTLHYHTSSVCGFLPLKQSLQVGIQVSKEAFKGFHRAVIELGTSNILLSVSSVLSVKPH